MDLFKNIKIFDKKQLDYHIEQRHINVNQHPTEEIYILNYAPICQYDAIWTEVSMQCRGLILDKDGNIVARPFSKFFNYEQLKSEEIPTQESFEVYEKKDGCLAILYFVDNKPYIATRGSFVSDQAQAANVLLNAKYSHLFDKLKKDRTYLFEYIQKNFRIVVNYGDIHDLFLLAVIDNETGLDLPLEDIGFPLTKKYDGIKDFKVLSSIIKDDEEGFVILFKSGKRIKIKGAEYCRLHRIITQVSNVNIWEYLKEGKSFDEVLDRVPDEFYSFVRKTRDDLLAQYATVENEAKKAIELLNNQKDNSYNKSANKREQAFFFRSHKHWDIIFELIKDRHSGKINKVDELIWKKIRPKFAKPFMNNADAE